MAWVGYSLPVQRQLVKIWCIYKSASPVLVKTKAHLRIGVSYPNFPRSIVVFSNLISARLGSSAFAAKESSAHSINNSVFFISGVWVVFVQKYCKSIDLFSFYAFLTAFHLFDALHALNLGNELVEFGVAANQE